MPELLAPAGNWECAKAAVENGADAIYFGLEKFNARMRADNFTVADLPELMAWLHQRGVKGYLTINTLIFTEELPAVEKYLQSAILAGVDAAIVQDVGLCRLIRQLSPDFPIHASTQMTITSAAGVEFAHELGCNLVVLARECSIAEINKIQQQLTAKQIAMPLEVFVHGALCVAYSGQCLTSEALGGRSANRGECAQACRMPYDLIVDDRPIDLGDRQYLLSPQDLSGLAVLPELVATGVSSLKIEGRLKNPEYVASVTQVYRSYLDRLQQSLGQKVIEVSDKDSYQLEMAFSRGLYSGWFKGIDNQELVHARFGKKRGVYIGEVTKLNSSQDAVSIRSIAPIKAGDGVVFDRGHPESSEQGGRVYEVFKGANPRADIMLTFGSNAIDFRRINIGDKVWKTSDPELDKEIRKTYAGDIPKFQRAIDIEIHGELNTPLIAIATDETGHIVKVESTQLLTAAIDRPLTDEKLIEQFSRLGNTPFKLGNIHNRIQGNLIVPVSNLNQMRREIVEKLTAFRAQPPQWEIELDLALTDLYPTDFIQRLEPPQLNVLIRKLDNLESVIDAGINTIYCEFTDPKQYKTAVSICREKSTELKRKIEIFIVPPRITKHGENWILDALRISKPDGYLIGNYDQLKYFKTERCIGNFNLNVANPITVEYFHHNYQLDRLTAAYDLNIDQLCSLIRACHRDRLEITIHQHMPMFHMEHCVFCAFLSDGKDYTNCGRPCEEYSVKMRDRVGTEHILHADVGCRNTLYNGIAQTGAEYLDRLLRLGAYNFRLEFLDEPNELIIKTIAAYQQLLRGEINGTQLWKNLRLSNQLGVTRGNLASRSPVADNK
jgi:U32 family peptidase